MRDGSSADKYRNHGRFAGERAFDFVGYIVLLALRRTVLQYLAPARADDHKHRGGASDSDVNCLREVLTWSDTLDVHEDAILSMSFHSEVIGNAAGVCGRILTPVADKDLGRG